jgi:hypothetical protein
MRPQPGAHGRGALALARGCWSSHG